MTPLEAQFHSAMLDLYRNAKTRCNYTATYFLQMVTDDGGLATARTLLHSAHPASGFAELWECGALDLTVEAQVLRSEFAELFTDEERAIARQRLADYGYRG
ncbi:MAG: hypothetical protein H3C34_20210 [Caldilineaceae bacterium]|nr:hypothetical protein [Caldilineaceae bacterium]